MNSRILAAFLGIILMGWFSSAYAWEGLPCAQKVFEASEEYLVCDVLEVDPECGALLVRAAGQLQWLLVAPEATITRNGTPAGLESLAPISRGVFQEAYLRLDSTGAVVLADAWYCALPAQIVRVLGDPVEKVWVRWLDSAEKTLCELRVSDTFSLPTMNVFASMDRVPLVSNASFPAVYSNCTGLVIVSRSGQLRYFVPDYQ